MLYGSVSVRAIPRNCGPCMVLMYRWCMRSGEFYDGFHGSAKWLSGRRGSSGSNGRRAIFDIDSSVGTENSYAA